MDTIYDIDILYDKFISMYNADVAQWMRQHNGQDIYEFVIDANTLVHERIGDELQQPRLYHTEAQMESVRKLIGAKLVFNPIGDGSCLFGAVAAGVIGAPKSVAEDRTHVKYTKQCIARAIIDQFNANAARVNDARESIELLKANVIASLDVDGMAREDLEKCFKEEAGDEHFLRWLNTEYCNDMSVMGGAIELSMIPASSLRCNVVLVDGDKSAVCVENETRITTDNVYGALFAITCYMAPDNEKTIVVERFYGHYRLLGVVDDAILSHVITLSTVTRAVNDMRCSMYVAMMALGNDKTHVDDYIRLQHVLADDTARAPHMYAFFSAVWDQIVIPMQM